LVLGAGMLGLTACAMLRSGGAERVVCVDPEPARRLRARQFGCDEAVAPDAVAALRPRHGFDAVFEFSGQSSAFAQALSAVGIGGAIVLVGAVFPGPAVELVPERLVRGNLRITGVHNYAPRHLHEAIAFLAAQHTAFPFAQLVAGWVPLGEAARAFALAQDRQTVRIGVVP
jgi:alcohol dehydrogenase